MDSRIAEQMTDHVTSLAKEHHVKVRWITDWKGAISFEQTNTVYVPVIRRPSDYLFCLHELGHVISPEARNAWTSDGSISRYEELLCEGAAWAWAGSQAKPALTRHLRAKDWNTVAYAYRTYLAGLPWTRTRLPKRGHRAP